MGRSWSITGLAAVLLVATTNAWTQPLSTNDRSAIADNLQLYRNAWLKGDANAVMATLAENAVLLPSGLPPIVGDEAIRAFWWPPDSPPTKVLAMELAIEETAGQAGLAYAWGRGSLTFSYQQDGQEKTVSTESTFLNVLRKQADGKWKTTCRMWSDRPRR